MSQLPEFRFTVSLPASGGFLGRQCNGSECGRYFKVHKEDISADLHCPYCGSSFPNTSLWTDDQRHFIEGAVRHGIVPDLAEHFRETIRRAFSGPSWTFTPGDPTPRPPMPPPPPERHVDSELQCPDCKVRFQVDGIFGYCPGCRSENLRLYDANLAVIRRELTDTSTPARGLRHAYSDLVSTFEIFCRKEADSRSMSRGRFQNLAATRQAFLAAVGADILSDLSAVDDLALRRVFQKRHVLEHNDGTIDQRYVGEVPEDAALLGQKASLSVEELESAAHALRKALAVLVSSR